MGSGNEHDKDWATFAGTIIGLALVIAGVTITVYLGFDKLLIYLILLVMVALIASPNP